MGVSSFRAGKSDSTAVRVALWMGVFLLAFAAFIVLGHEASARGGSNAIDGATLRWMVERRRPFLTERMIDLTALGSPTVVAVFTLATFAFLLVREDRRAIVHLAVASMGTWALTSVMKKLIERRRPTEVAHLVDVTGFSFPSGHALASTALYLTIALIVCGELRSRALKAVVIAVAAALVSMVAISRVYLGVHYPSDVLSGLSVGASWALVLAATVANLAPRPASE